MSDDPFWPLLMYFFLVLLVIAAMLGAPALLGERHRRKPLRRDERGTAMAYESGIAPTGDAQLRVPLQYYLIAMLFVMFDLEAVYLYGWALVASEAGWMGFMEVAVFIALLMTALVYLWHVGALDWSLQRDRVRGRPRPSTIKDGDQRALVA
jgi:NADH-quinone oxidoreductase subunit A